MLVKALPPTDAAAVRARPGRLRREAGATLVEVLVALVVLAFGLLGILGVQMRTLADTQTSVRRAQAIRLIEDFRERVQLNPNALDPAVANNYLIGAWGSSPGAPGGCATACTPAQLATNDMRQWLQNVRQTLPLGDARIFLSADEAGTAVNRRQLGVMVAWRENERTADADYVGVFRNAATSGAVACDTDKICHLQFIPLSSRCVPDALSGGQVFCASGVATLP